MIQKCLNFCIFYNETVDEELIEYMSKAIILPLREVDYHYRNEERTTLQANGEVGLALVG